MLISPAPELSHQLVTSAISILVFVSALHHIAAMAGVTEAQVSLGQRYLLGEDVIADCETAAWYLEAVAKQSHAEHHQGGSEQAHEMKRLTAETEGTVDVGELGDDDERIAYQVRLGRAPHRFSPFERGDTVSFAWRLPLTTTRTNSLVLTSSNFASPRRAPLEKLLLAEQGNAEAMVAMGDLYYYGARGVARDQGRAFEWFRAAAREGHATGQVACANLLLKGEGTDKNHSQAMKWCVLASCCCPPCVASMPPCLSG